MEQPSLVIDTAVTTIGGPSNCRLCSEVSLRANVNSLGLSFDANHVISSTMSESESLLLALARNSEFDTNRAVNLISALHSNSNLEGLSVVQVEWYKQLISNEYGCHGIWCIQGIMPMAATLALLALYMDTNIFVITNNYVLKSFHRGTNVIKFPATSEFASNCVISVGGFGIFHGLSQPEDGSETWSRIKRFGFTISEINLEEMPRALDISRPRRQFDIPSIIDSADPIDPVQGTEETLGEASLNLPPVHNDSIYISSYLDRHTSIEGNILNIAPTAYTNTSKIKLHNIENVPCSYRQSYDIDGLFVMGRWENIIESCKFNSHALLNPSAISKAELGSIRKHYKESEIGPSGPITASKIAVIDSSFGALDFYCVVVVKPEQSACFQSINLTKIFVDAIQFSISAPCFDLVTSEDHHPNCTNPSHRLTINGLRKNWEDAKGTIPLDKESFQCFSNHIGRFVKSDLRKKNIPEPALFYFIKGVGMKFNFIEDDLHSLVSAFDDIGAILNLNFIKPNHVFLDFCITSLCIPENNIDKVKNYYLFDNLL